MRLARTFLLHPCPASRTSLSDLLARLRSLQLENPLCEDCIGPGELRDARVGTPPGLPFFLKLNLKDTG